MNKEEYEKISSYYGLLVVWLEMRQKGKTIVPYMIEKNYKRIAIYGMKELGHRLVDELYGSEIVVKYVIDKSPVLGEFNVIKPEEEFDEVDAIVVTADYYYDEIKDELSKKCSYPIISLRGLLGNAFGRNF